MLKLIVSLLVVLSTLSALSPKQQQEGIQQANESLEAQGSTMRMYHYDSNNKSKRNEYGYNVDFLTPDKSAMQTIIDNTCSNSKTRKAINNGWTFNYKYRNKTTLKKVISFQVNQDSCPDEGLARTSKELASTPEGSVSTSLKSAIMKGALIGGTLMIIGLILVFILKIIQKILSLTKKKMTSTKNKITSIVSNDVAPYMAEKKYEIERDLMENKILKLKNLLDNEIITNEEYQERIDKIRSKH